MTNNQYKQITNYYDLWVTSGYYDYQTMAQEANSIIGNSCEVIELGVGTGLLAEKYIEIDPTCQFTGIDLSESMLNIAKKRLEDNATLIEADVVTMNLKKTFDVAISNGGIWVSYYCGNCSEVGSLIPKIEDNLPGLVNLANHLHKGGLFLMNIQKPHDNLDNVLLSEDIVYSQSVKNLVETEDYRIIEKNYFFKKDQEIVAQEQHKITLFKQDAYEQIFNKAGFRFQGNSGTQKFAIFKKS